MSDRSSQERPGTTAAAGGPLGASTQLSPTPTKDTSYTMDELMITVMARQLHGEVLVSSVTALGALAAHLAKRTHAPDLAVLSTPESGMEVAPIPTLTLGQFLTDAQQGIPLTMEDIFDAIFLDRFRIWINPAQVDRHGHVNITAIGPWDHPKVALVGSRGIPEDTSHLSQILYYVTSHTPRSVVAQVDFRSGAGYGPDRMRELGQPGSPTLLVTNLGVFDWNGPEHTLAVVSLHPGVTAATVAEATPFPVALPDPVPTTTEPTAAELALIRAADPLDVRKLEFLSGRAAAEGLVNIYERERQALHAAVWPHRRSR
ncbi:MAG: CoA-transferase [Thermaerobacter sp.]|nr:CoA-transferase [Thermaerobacter sp.]